MKGIGICDGSIADMQAAIAFATDIGKGIYTMKALGGGHLSSSAATAFSWIRQQERIDAIAVGMQSTAEVAVNCAVFGGLQPNTEDVRRVCSKPRNLLVEDWCVGCGHCVENCPMGAMQVIVGRAVPDMRKCVLCGYCGAHCPEFCIKVI
jgi:ferredoxin